MNDMTKRRLVGGAVLAVLALSFAVLFFRAEPEPGVPPAQESDLADVRTYAIEVPAVPEQPPQEILAQDPPIGTLLPGPAEKPAGGKDGGKPAPASKPKPAAEPKPAPATTAIVPDVGWSVQVGSFASRQNADGLLKRLKEMGYPAFIYRNADENPPLFRVRAGPYTEQDAAREAAQRLREQLRLDVKVVANG
jgi:cell division septation protein DedD